MSIKVIIFIVFSAFEILDVNHGITLSLMSEIVPEIKHLTHERMLEHRLHIEALYDHAVQEQAHEIEILKAEEALVIPRDVDYNSDYLCLGFEDREKLMAVQPPTVRKLRFLFVFLYLFVLLQIAAATRIPGVTPSSILRLLKYVKQHSAIS